MVKEQYMKCIENFGKVQEYLPCKENIDKYPYFLIGRLLMMKYEKMGDKTILALMHPDRAKLSAILQARITTPKEKNKPIIDEKTEDPKQVLLKRLRAIEAEKEDPMSILEKRLREIEENKKLLQEASPEDFELFEPEPSVSLDELVKKFNNQPPSITPIWENFEEERLYRDLGKNSSQEKMNIISETLAEIYISQKLYDKAIKIYQELMLKYPEKNAIFASLIEKLKKNINEN